MVSYRGIHQHAAPLTVSEPGNVSGTADSIRRALIDAAEAAYEDAGIQGLCAEGRWEAAVSAMRNVDLQTVVQGSAASGASSSQSSSSTESTPPAAPADA